MASVTRPRAPARQSEPTIPLVCTICPKRPNFSDVSHLLTHISSKSHLSTRFKLQLRAAKEIEVRERLVTFDSWYIAYGIETLLADRMAAKDKKRGVKRGRPSSSDEVNQRSAIELPAPVDFSTHDERGLGPKLYHWNTAQPGQPVAFPSGPGPYYPNPVNPAFETPYPHEAPELLYPATPVAERYGKLPSETESTISGLPAEQEREIELAEHAKGKLKGVIWPGMDWFDAATDDMRRKRNQKKDCSVLEGMKHTSQVVEATEFVWTPGGDFQRTRDIFASPSIEGSPEPEYREEIKRKRTRRPLGDITNLPRGRQQTGRANGRGRKPRATRGKAPVQTSNQVIDQDDVFRDPPERRPDRRSAEERFQQQFRLTGSHQRDAPRTQSPTPAFRRAAPRFFGRKEEGNAMSFGPQHFADSFYMQPPNSEGNGYNPLWPARPVLNGYQLGSMEDDIRAANNFHPINGPRYGGTVPMLGGSANGFAGQLQRPAPIDFRPMACENLMLTKPDPSIAFEDYDGPEDDEEWENASKRLLSGLAHNGKGSSLPR